MSKKRKRKNPEERGQRLADGKSPSHDSSLPSERDFDPYGGFLDAQCAWRNFGGLTLDEANEKFRERPEIYQEDFMFMGGKAFDFYFAVIESYLRETAACNEYDDRQAWILAHAILSQFKTKTASHVKHLSPRILKLAKFVRQNIGLFSPDPEEQRRIDTAWQELQDYVASQIG